MANNNSVSISSEINNTVIGPKTKFKGTVSTDKPIIIEGYFEGTIESSGSVEITQTGTFDGELACKELVLRGKALGKVQCSDIFRFADTGKFKGDAVVKNLDIRPGSDFDGNLKILK